MILSDYLKPVVLQVQKLIADSECHTQWQSRICQWVESDEVKPRFEEVEEFEELDGARVPVTVTCVCDDFHPLIPLNSSPEYMFAILAAVNDVAARDDTTVVALNPFSEGLSKPKLVEDSPEQVTLIRGVPFSVLTSRVNEIAPQEVQQLHLFLDVIRGELGVEASKSSRRRGRKKTDIKIQQRECDLASDWKQARVNGVYKGDFAKDNGMCIKDLEKLLNRVSKRKKRSDN